LLNGRRVIRTLGELFMPLDQSEGFSVFIGRDKRLDHDGGGVHDFLARLFRQNRGTSVGLQLCGEVSADGSQSLLELGRILEPTRLVEKEQRKVW
jgi:hypothetical protein